MVARAHLRVDRTTRDSGWMQVILSAGSMLMFQFFPQREDGGSTLLISAAPLQAENGLFREERRYSELDRDRMEALVKHVLLIAKRKWGGCTEVLWSIEDLETGNPQVVPLGDVMQESNFFEEHFSELRSNWRMRLPLPDPCDTVTELVIVDRLFMHERRLLLALLDCWIVQRFGRLSYFSGKNHTERSTELKRSLKTLGQVLDQQSAWATRNESLKWKRGLDWLLEQYRRRLERQKGKPRALAQPPWRAVAVAIRDYQRILASKQKGRGRVLIRGDLDIAINSKTAAIGKLLSEGATEAAHQDSIKAPAEEAAEAAHQDLIEAHPEGASEAARHDWLRADVIPTIENPIPALEQPDPLRAQLEGATEAAHQGSREAQLERAIEVAHQHWLRGDAKSSPMDAMISMLDEVIQTLEQPDPMRAHSREAIEATHQEWVRRSDAEGDPRYAMIPTVEEGIQTLEQPDPMRAQFERLILAAHRGSLETQLEGAIEAAPQDWLRGGAKSDSMYASIPTIEDPIPALEQPDSLRAQFEGAIEAAHQDSIEAHSEGAMEAAHRDSKLPTFEELIQTLKQRKSMKAPIGGATEAAHRDWVRRSDAESVSMYASIPTIEDPIPALAQPASLRAQLEGAMEAAHQDCVRGAVESITMSASRREDECSHGPPAKRALFGLEALDIC